MFVYDRVPNLMPRRMCACSNARREELAAAVAAVVDRGRVGQPDPRFPFGDDPLRLFIATMNHQPTRTLRNPTAKENHNKTERSADSKSETPSQPGWYPTRIEQNKRGGCAECGADPV